MGNTALLPAPVDLGLPEKFMAWRPYQDDAVLRAIDSPKRFMVEICPTGSGKSLTYVSAIHLQGLRGVVLTSTKALQSQLMQDFESMGMTAIMGRNAYPCIRESGISCEEALCSVGYNCTHKGEGDMDCPYYLAYHEAKLSRMVVTNYAYWSVVNTLGKGLGHFDYMVCDEAHNLPEVLSSLLTINLNGNDPLTANLLPAQYDNYTIAQWKSWAQEALTSIHEEVEELQEILKENVDSVAIRRRFRKASYLADTIRKAAVRLDYEWVPSYRNKIVSFCPLWPRKFSEDVLFMGMQRILLTSATVCAKTCELLGIDEDNTEMVEYPHTFPLDIRRLIYIPTVRMNHLTSTADIKKWLNRIDQIIAQRLDRKGIVHSVSYARRNLILQHSKYSKYMMTHDTGSTIEAIKQFKEAKAPAIFVSPSVTTGHDFPYDSCEYQIISKIAYPDTRDPVIKARATSDPEYAAYIAMQQLVQACGRIVRSEDDYGETFIIDDNVVWFRNRFEDFAPQWWHDAFTYSSTIPQAIERR